MPRAFHNVMSARPSECCPAASPLVGEAVLRLGRLLADPACEVHTPGAYWFCLGQAPLEVDPVAYRMVGEPGSARYGRNSATSSIAHLPQEWGHTGHRLFQVGTVDGDRQIGVRGEEDLQIGDGSLLSSMTNCSPLSGVRRLIVHAASPALAAVEADCNRRGTS